MYAEAGEFLRRDVENVVSYFSRKYPTETPETDVDGVATAIRADEFETVRDFA